jgi:hypothetical protein
MPQPTSPPYQPNAQIIPRQLDQWIDVNNQNGKLVRCSTFITLQPFTANQGFSNLSQIVASYNFEAPNNFTLTSGYRVPINPNYTLCISYRVGLTITRYVLWSVTGFNCGINLPQYTGQIILKNFRFEVWNTTQGVATEVNTYTFYTSKLQPIDYRYGSDTILVNPDSLNTSFICNTSTAGLSPSAVNQIGWFRADTAQTNTWTGFNESYCSNLNPGISFTLGVDNTFKNGNYVSTLSPFYPNVIHNGVGDPLDIWILMKFTQNGGLCAVQVSATQCLLSTTAGVIYIDGTSTGITMTVGNWYIVEWWQIGTTNGVFVWQMGSVPFNPQTYTTQCTANSRASSTGIYFGDPNVSRTAEIADIILYNQGLINQSTQITNLAYFADRYVTQFALPLVFPLTSVSTTN